MIRLTLIALSAWVLISCNSKLKTSEDSADSGLADIKMNFTMKSFPWKEGVDATKQKEFFANLSLAFEAPKAEKQGANCKEASSQKLNMSSSTDKLSMKGVKLTKKCTYNMKMEISDAKVVYFATDASSISQPIPDDGRIKNYKLCLKNAGDLFDPAKAKACIASSETGGDTDVVINPIFGNGTNDQQKDTNAPLNLSVADLLPVLLNKAPTEKLKLGTLVQVEAIIVVIENRVTNTLTLASTPNNFKDKSIIAQFPYTDLNRTSPLENYNLSDKVIITGQITDSANFSTQWIIAGDKLTIKKSP